MTDTIYEFDDVIEKMANIPDGIIVMTDSHHGVYAPQVFLQSLAAPITNVSQRDIDTVLKGPNDVKNEWYWEAWDSIEQNAVITSKNGDKFMIYQDGDIFLLNVRAYEQATKELEDDEQDDQ